nr:immunoglobulin heavy chain junction region [Mus musculus]
CANFDYVLYYFDYW